MKDATHLLTLADGYLHQVALNPYTKEEIWGLEKFSEIHSMQCGEAEDPESSVWYATPIAELLLEQGTLTLVAL